MVAASDERWTVKRSCTSLVTVGAGSVHPQPSGHASDWQITHESESCGVGEGVSAVFGELPCS